MNCSNVYFVGDFLVVIFGMLFGLIGYFGYNFGLSWFVIDVNGKKEYIDWLLGVILIYKVIMLGVFYVDIDVMFFLLIGKVVLKGGIVGSIGVSF